MQRLLKRFVLSSRLKKIALGGNIKESDVEFVYEGDQMKMVLTNEEKAMHETSEDWQGEYFDAENNPGSGDVIGFIQYNDGSNPNGSYSIYVDYMEMREEYRQTRAVKFLMNEFKAKIIDPAIDKYGKEKVNLAATVVNGELAGFLERLTDKLGISFNADGSSLRDPNDLVGDLEIDTSDDDDDYDGSYNAEEKSKQFNEVLKNAGAQLINSYDVCIDVKNFSITQYHDLAKSVGVDVEGEIHGSIDMNSGDIVISFIYDGVPGGFSEIVYSHEAGKVWLENTIEDYINASNLIDNLKTVFSDSTGIYINNELHSLEEFAAKFMEIKNTQ